MNKEQKEAWLREAKMQMKAIQTLEKYNMAALALAGLGAALCYFTIVASAQKNPLFIAGSIILAAVGALCSMVLNVGIRNGKRNVEKILNAVEGKEPPASEKKAPAGAGKAEKKE